MGMLSDTQDYLPKITQLKNGISRIQLLSDTKVAAFSTSIHKIDNTALEFRFICLKSKQEDSNS